MAQDVIVVFDFDWSLVNENTDTFVLERLGGQRMKVSFRIFCNLVIIRATKRSDE